VEARMRCRAWLTHYMQELYVGQLDQHCVDLIMRVYSDFRKRTVFSQAIVV